MVSPIVQGGAGDRCARQKDRVKSGRGCQHAGAAHGNFDAVQGRLLDFRRVLERDGPAREFIGRTHPVTLCKIVHLDHGTVHVKVEGRTALADLLDLCNGGFDVVHHMVAGRDRQPKALEVIQTFGVGRQLLAADLLNIEHKDGQAAAPGDLGVFLAQRPGGRIARVFERCRALQLLLSAQVPEGRVGHIHLTAHFQKFRCVFELFRDALDGLDVGGHILADHAIAAGRSPHQHSILVLQAAGKAVDLDFDHIFRFHARFPHPAVKVTQFLKRKCVQQALHLDGVRDLSKPSARGAADVLGRRSRRDQLRELRFQFLQLPRQGSVFKILQFRGGLIVV